MFGVASVMLMLVNTPLSGCFCGGSSKMLKDYTFAAAKCNHKGVELLKLHKFPEAANMFRSAIEFNHNYVGAYTNLAFTYIMLEDHIQAIPILETAIRLEPANFLNYFYFGVAHAVLKNLTLAIDAFENAISLKPSFKPAFFRVGLVYLLLNETVKANERFTYISRDSLVEAYTRAGLQYVVLNQTAIHNALRL